MTNQNQSTSIIEWLDNMATAAQVDDAVLIAKTVVEMTPDNWRTHCADAERDVPDASTIELVVAHYRDRIKSAA